jgi:16S rRNA (uracil1498-N3)-methyltransferase
MSAARPPRFLVPDGAIAGKSAVLTGNERHHLRVRRIREGDAIELFNDQGQVFHGVVTALTNARAEIAVCEHTAAARESPLDLTLAVAALKADKLDLVIEKATELGVTRVVVFTSERSLGRPAVSRIQRWRRIAVSAAKQCGRSRVPAVEGPEPLGNIATRRADVRLVCWERESGAPSGPLPQRASSVLLVVGPEGGFTNDEIARLRDGGLTSVSLGLRILRGETAAIAAVVLAQARWGDLPGTP